MWEQSHFVVDARRCECLRHGSSCCASIHFAWLYARTMRGLCRVLALSSILALPCPTSMIGSDGGNRANSVRFVFLRSTSVECRCDTVPSMSGGACTRAYWATGRLTEQVAAESPDGPRDEMGRMEPRREASRLGERPQPHGGQSPGGAERGRQASTGLLGVVLQTTASTAFLMG